MHSHHPERPLDRPSNHDTYSPYSFHDTLWDRLQQPSVVVPLVLILFTVFYQSLHSSPFSQPRHSGELLWDFLVTATPATLLYTLDSWLHPPLFPVPKSMLPTQSRSYAAKSELLRKILGMDKPGSLVNTVAHASRRSLSTLSNSAFVKLNTDQPPGLGNYDNSCFQNSILQGLSSLKPLPPYLAAAFGQNEVDGNRDPGSAATLRDLISKLTDARNNGTTLWTPRKLKSLDTWQQQDAQEYFSKILDEVDKEVTKATHAQHRPLGLETNGVRDETEDSQHSDDSGYQSLPVLSKVGPEARSVRNPLEGLVAQRVACVQCGYSEGLSMIPFNCLTLNLGIGQGDHDLYERLDSYTDLEAIQGVECAKCTLLKVQRLLKILVSRGRDVGTSEDNLQEPLSRLEAVELALEEDDFEEKTLADKCKISKQHRVTSTKTKQMVIARPPQSLAIHINRSVFDEYTGYMSKNFAAVRFPSTLDLGPWCLGSAGISTTNSGLGNDAKSIGSTLEEEQWLSDPRSSMVSGDLNPSNISGPIYELRAVITHQGRHENGHYVCYRRHPHGREKAIDSDKHPKSPVGGNSNNIQKDEKTLTDVPYSDDFESSPDLKWWRLSDETVRPVSEEAVLAQGGVFMLFYDCVDPNSVLVTKNYDGGMNTPSRISTVNSIDHFVADNENTTEHDPKSHDTTSNLMPAKGTLSPAKAICTAEYNDNAVIESGEAQRKKTEVTTTSCLIPLLSDGERVDPVIPLHRPNS